MNTLFLSHNPFTFETKIGINKSNFEDSSGMIFAQRRRNLQEWVADFIDAIPKVFFYVNEFKIGFQGIESDYLDVKKAVEEANNRGMNISLEYVSVTSSRSVEERLTGMQDLIERIYRYEYLFRDRIAENTKGLKAAFDKNFEIHVVATMSSGKSTLINAMLGCDVLPAMNEATTATIARITDNDHKPDGQYSVKRINHEDDEVDSCELNFSSRDNAEEAQQLMKLWNSMPDTKSIEIDGNIIGVFEREDVRLVLSDTLGPNNSQNEEHGLTTMRYLQDNYSNSVILYVLNGEQLGINDDSQLLRQIAEMMKKGGKPSQDHFIFILNKADKFDPEKGECISSVLARAKAYLEHNGIENPKIYPVSAYLASLFRKRALNPDLLTRKERSDLMAMEDLFTEENTMDLVQYMSLSKTVRETLENQEMNLALYRSGLPAIEAMIDEYIAKYYSLPCRIAYAYQAIQNIIDREAFFERGSSLGLRLCRVYQNELNYIVSL